jgi:hypothetical protein
MRFDDAHIYPFVSRPWSTIGESFITPTPERSIAQRVEAVKSMVRSQDKILVLSPFDHLISYYADPGRYCGHFEILTNVAASSDIDSVLVCARTSENLLVVYDKALEIGCPEGEMAVYFERASCLSKYELKTTLREIMRRLESNLILIKEVGDLKFYRLATKAAAGS